MTLPHRGPLIHRPILDNVERVPAVDVDVDAVDRVYLRRGVPVILTGIYDGAPVRRLEDPTVARAELGHISLPITPHPIDQFLRGETATPPRTATLGEFFDDLTAAVGPQEICVEHDTPFPLSAYLPPPRYLDLGEMSDSWVTHMFMGGPGNSTHLHFDQDHRNVLMYQVFGHKRYVMFDPAQTRKLAPGVPPSVSYASALYLEHFTAPDLEAFLRYADAWECVLGPGEAVFMPADVWHYVEYLDVTLSVNFRLCRNRYLSFLAEAVPAPSVEMQAIASRFRDERRIGRAEARAFAALEAAANRRYPSPDARMEALDMLCVELCGWLGLPVAGAPYHWADIDRRDQMLRGA
jgi:Cupin-like domain